MHNDDCNMCDLCHVLQVTMVTLTIPTSVKGRGSVYSCLLIRLSMPRALMAHSQNYTLGQILEVCLSVCVLLRMCVCMVDPGSSCSG